MPSNTDPHRLPTHVQPSAYRLRLDPDLAAATFAGTVEIDLEVTEPTRSVMLKPNELDLDQPTLRGADGAPATGTVTLDEAHERASISMPAELAVGEYVLSIGFKGLLNDQLRGFYRSTFADAGGTAHTIATTQFESTDARRAFPCFDEPAFKATYEVTLVVAAGAGTAHRIATPQFESTDARRAFPCFDEPAFKATYEVTLVVPAGLSAYSNSPVAKDTPLDDGRREVSFTPTMKMSTYLVAFVIGPFESTPAVNVDGVPLAVVYPPGKGPLADFALESGAFSLRFFSEYFNIPYPGEKVDLLAIPDFAAGAMENLGCITFRETALLVDPATASQLEIQRVAQVVAHELAHMWFGDLVTMQWWEGIWLNEAFATFMEELCCDAFRPAWKRWVLFGISRDAALGVDSLHSTRPIEYRSEERSV